MDKRTKRQKELVEQFNEKLDEVFALNGVEIVVDKRSMLYLDGVTVDFHDDLNKRGFMNRFLGGNSFSQDPAGMDAVHPGQPGSLRVFFEKPVPDTSRVRVGIYEQFAGGAGPQWGGRYTLLSGALLLVAATVVLEGHRAALVIRVVGEVAVQWCVEIGRAHV